jgi:tetratricopeptide (TPR) repeat protein
MPLSPVGPDGSLRLVWEETVFLFHRFTRDQAVALTLVNLGWVHRREGDADAAHAAVSESLERFRALDDGSGEALALAALGNLARARGEPDAALAQLEASLSLRTALGERREVGVSLLGIAGAHAAAGEIGRARDQYAAVIARFEATDDLPAIAGAHANWGVMEERDGDLERAPGLMASGAEFWDRQRTPRFGAWMKMARGCALRALGDDDEARRAWATARATLAVKDDPLGVAILDELLAPSPR